MISFELRRDEVCTDAGALHEHHGYDSHGWHPLFDAIDGGLPRFSRELSISIFEPDCYRASGLCGLSKGSHMN